MREVENIQNTYKHRTLSQIAHEIGISKFSDDTEDQENIENHHQTAHESFQNRSERPRQIFSRPRKNHNQTRFQKASDKNVVQSQASNETNIIDDKTAHEEPTMVSGSSSKPNEKEDVETYDSNEAFKKSKSDKMSIELDDLTSYTTTSKRSDLEKRKRVRKSRRVTSEALLAIADGGTKARANKAASNASESLKDEADENVINELQDSPSNSCKYYFFY